MALCVGLPNSTSFGSPWSAIPMGLWFRNNAAGAATQHGWAYAIQGWQGRLRPSHSAVVSGSQRTSETWDRHPKRWGDDRQIPIPMSRGIPFRGDSLGASGFRAAAVLQATG